jgi:hypothetical protein
MLIPLVAEGLLGVLLAAAGAYQIIPLTLRGKAIAASITASTAGVISNSGFFLVFCWILDCQ